MCILEQVFFLKNLMVAKMKKVYLISCVKKKHSEPKKAEELYQSTFFKKSLAYAKKMKGDGIYILSAKHGLLHLSDVIRPYEKTLNAMPLGERKTWGENVFTQLSKVEDIDNTEFVFLAGNRYREFLLPLLPLSSVPMYGLPIGKQLKYLTA